MNRPFFDFRQTSRRTQEGGLHVSLSGKSNDVRLDWVNLLQVTRLRFEEKGQRVQLFLSNGNIIVVDDPNDREKLRGYAKANRFNHNLTGKNHRGTLQVP